MLGVYGNVGSNVIGLCEDVRPQGVEGQHRGNDSDLHSGAEAGGFAGQVSKHRWDNQICGEGDADNVRGCRGSGTFVVGDGGSELPDDS